MTAATNQQNHLNDFQLLPPRPGVCQTCAVDHDPKLPHNAQSLFYQYKFNGDNGRWPDWNDAMAHCSEEVKTNWVAALTQHGIKA